MRGEPTPQRLAEIRELARSCGLSERGVQRVERILDRDMLTPVDVFDLQCALQRWSVARQVLEETLTNLGSPKL